MLLVVVFALFFSVRATHPDSAIVLNVDDQYKCNVQNMSKFYCPGEEKNFTVTVNTPLILKTARCHYEHNHESIFFNYTDMFKNKSFYDFQVKSNSSTFTMPEWKCLFCSEERTECATCNVTLNVVNLDMAPIVAINGQERAPQLVKSSKPYDSVFEYEFYDGEPVNIICRKNATSCCPNSLIFITTNFIIANKTIIPKEFASDFEEMYVLMSEQHDQRYFECRGSNFHNNTNFITRIIFKHQEKLGDFVGFKVNNLKLIKEDTKTSQTIGQYQYFDGENITVSPFLRGYDIHQLACNIKAKRDIQLDGLEWQFSLRSDEANKTIKCQYYGKEIMNLKLYPIDKLPDTSNVTISGLPFSSILTKYIHDLDTQVIYASAGRKILNLTSPGCNHTTYMKKIEEQEDDLTANIYINSVPYYYNQTSYVTFGELNKIVLYLVDPHIATNVQLVKTEQNESLPKENGLPAPYIVSIVVCGTVVVILIVSCIIHKRMRKRKLRNMNPGESEYAALSDNREVSIPTQWNDYVAPHDFVAPDNTGYIDDTRTQGSNTNYSVPYTPKTVQEMYATPIPKSQRNKPPIEQNEHPYAKVLPKNMRPASPGNISSQILQAHAKVLKTKTENRQLKTESPYAEIAQSESPYDVVAQSEGPYVVIDHSQRPDAKLNVTSESPYAVPQSYYSNAGTIYDAPNVGYEEATCNCLRANLNDCYSNEYTHHKYCNVFRKGSYVNTDGSKPDYVEPAYFTKD